MTLRPTYRSPIEDEPDFDAGGFGDIAADSRGIRPSFRLPLRPRKSE